MANRILLGFVVAILHLAATIACLSRTTFPNSPSDLWGAILSILSFPLLYLLRLEQYIGRIRFFGSDGLDWLVVLNSILWGFCAAMLFWFLRKRATRQTTAPGSH